MIPRFTRKEMAAIWEPENRFRIWLEVELLACEAQAELGVIPKDAPARIRKKADFDVERIDAIEREVKHDVIAFLTSVGEFVGKESRFIHVGMTSSDVLDTSFAVQLKQASDLIIAGLDRVLAALKKRAQEHRNTICIGRSHGIHAEPTTFGVKLAGHYAAFARAKQRMLVAKEEISTCSISGAVGTFATIDPFVESYVAKKLGLKAETVSTQVIPRDRHAAVLRHAGSHRVIQHRKSRDGNPSFTKNGSPRSGGVFLERPKGLVGHAAQAQPRADRKPDRPCAHDPRLRHSGDGKRYALART